MQSRSVEAFLRRRRGRRLRWQSVASMKVESDRLAHTDLKDASRLVDRVEALAALIGDPRIDAFAQASRARLLHIEGKHGDANRLYQLAVTALLSFNLDVEAAGVRKQQVDALTELGRYDEALSVAREARRVLAKQGAVQLAQLETNVGNIYYRLDRYHQALQSYERARRLLAKNGDANMRAHVDLSRSNILSEIDRPDQALRLLESAASVWKRNGQSLMASQAEAKIAWLNFLRGNYSAALASYYHAREQLDELGSQRLVAWCNLEIAEVLLALNAFDDANEAAELARSRFSELGMPYESAQALLVNGLAAMGLGQLDQALDQLWQARDAFASKGNRTFAALIDSYLAELAIRQGKAVEGGARALLALRTFARQKLVTKAAHARLLAARAAYHSGEQRRASRLARSALRSVEGWFAPSVVYASHHLIGKLENDAGRTTNALDRFRRAVEVVEQMRGGIVADEFKATFLGDKIELYEDAISACLDKGGNRYVEEAFRLVESSKSRSLADLLSRYLREHRPPSNKSSRKSADYRNRERLIKAIEDLNWYSSQASLEDEKGGQRRAAAAERYTREIARCERQVAQLFRRLESNGSNFGDLQRLRAISASGLKNALDPRETAVEYFTTGNAISAFVISRDRIEVARNIAVRSEVEATLSALRFQIDKFNYGPRYADDYFEQLNGAANEYLARLYADLFARIEHLLVHKRLIIVPHGALHYVPFHALINRRGYLVDQFEMSYAPSATVLRLCRQKRSVWRRQPDAVSSQSRLVALGLAQPDTPNIADEIDALAEIFPNTVKLTGENATCKNLIRNAPGARYLHLASHGYFRRDNPMFSFLKLADSQLNFYGLMDLKLNAELVTLSACHTGVNKVFPGDELQGLMRGFLHAGAPSLVASLWATSDIATAELMKEMYKRIGAGSSKRSALREAQLAVKETYGHPYYWAPFILMGNPN
jgi:CHAT domain-containing protein